MLWCPHCLMWSARSPCRHCSSRRDPVDRRVEPKPAPRFLHPRPSAATAEGHPSAAQARHLWVVLLAAGEGQDFGDFSIRMFGNEIPKQFWSLDGTGGMMGWALSRALRLVPKDRVVAITRTDHARWAALRFRDLPPESVLVEPAERGTAPGLLLALMKITQVDPEAIVVLLPCDHHVEEEWMLAEAIADAAAVARERTGRIVLLGAPGEGRSGECTWILPKAPRAPRGGPWEVACIVNQHDLPATERLGREGAFVSTGIVVGSGAALAALYAAAVPDLVRACVGFMIESTDERESLRALYRELAPRDFNREVLNRSPEALAVARIPPCGWTDLGTPAKLREFLSERVISCPAIVPPAPADHGRVLSSQPNVV